MKLETLKEKRNKLIQELRATDDFRLQDLIKKEIDEIENEMCFNPFVLEND